jgi:hypothetical protein
VEITILISRFRTVKEHYIRIGQANGETLIFRLDRGVNRFTGQILRLIGKKEQF